MTQFAELPSSQYSSSDDSDDNILIAGLVCKYRKSGSDSDMEVPLLEFRKRYEERIQRLRTTDQLPINTLLIITIAA